VTAVVINLTSVTPQTDGFVTVWPTGEARPVIATLNYTAGRDIPNLAMCKLGAGGSISVYSSSGDLDLVGDVVGCYGPSGSGLVAVTPSRLLDTRIGLGAPTGPVVGGSEIAVPIVGRSGIPATARAVVMTLTAVGATSGSFVTVYPAGVARPLTASLNVTSGETIGNLVVAMVGTDGFARFYNHAGALHLVADVTGYFV
jgi:hypothetical protein